jgi:hypothetical protein
MIAIVLYLAWGLVVLLSFACLGRALARVLTPRALPDPFLAAGWGMAGMTVLGGLLNLLGAAGSSVLIALVLAIISSNLLFALSKRRSFLQIGEQDSSQTPRSPGGQTGRGDGIWIGLLALFVAFKSVSSLGVTPHPGDDAPAYLLLLARLLQTGSMGLDPFSERQLLSLNGQTFLLGLFGSVSPPQYAFLFDPGICWILIAGLTWTIIRRELSGSAKTSCLLTALVLMVRVPLLQNLGGYLTGAVLCLTLLRTAYRTARHEGNPDRGSLVLLALTVAGLCALKTTFLIFAALFIASWYGLRMRHSPRLSLVRELSLLGLTTAALLAPWMWQQYQSSGTPLYPLLGNGYDISGAGLKILDPVGIKLKSAIYFLLDGQNMPAILGLFLLAKNPFKGDPARWRVGLASLFAAALESSIIAYELGPKAEIGNHRYTQPILYSALIPVGLGGILGPRPSTRGTGLALCLAMFVGNQWENVHTSLAKLRDFVRAGPPGLLDPDWDRPRIRSAQAAIPPGKRILAGVRNGFLLDFSRNTIWNLDLPGMASPPPGMPIAADRSALHHFLIDRAGDLPPPAPCEQLLGYLRHAGIDFLIFQRGDSVWFLHPEIPDHPLWNRTAHAVGMLIYRQLTNLMNKCKILYDDGDMVVLDVRSPGGMSKAPDR